MNKSTQYCWKKDACQKVDCKFAHPRDKPQYCWRKDACQKANCKFIHPTDFDDRVASKSCEGLHSRNDASLSEQPIQDGACSIALQRAGIAQQISKPKEKRNRRRKNCPNNNRVSSSKVSHLRDVEHRTGSNQLESVQIVSEEVGLSKGTGTQNANVAENQRNDNSSSKVYNEAIQPKSKKENSVSVQQKCKQNASQKNRQSCSNSGASSHSSNQQPIVSIKPEWINAESEAYNQHRAIIDSIRENISEIILSNDYAAEYEKHEANIRVLRETIVELETHVFTYDSFKQRACHELASKPTELRNQIFREIYRLKCRLGTFAKRMEMEKYFNSGHRFLIVQGATGSGKSTQIPQYIADHPRFYGKKIICTQPRKLAAISLSRRVTFEYSGGVGNVPSSYVGYQVGGDRQGYLHSRIEFITEGVMLDRIMKGDTESFKNVGCIIIDEAHERSITCDLLLGSFKKPDPRWKDVFIVVTSATIDLTFFSEFFNNAPTVQIEGRTFSVDIIYQPVTFETEIQFAVTQCALQIHMNCKSKPGDILCFLPGLEDISNAKVMFEKELRKVTNRTDLLFAKIFILYGKQNPDQQAEVFDKINSSKERKIIFATDVAETSITIDGVVYVVDSGVKKEVIFDAERNISSLKINPISKSSAIQRAGRCGRTQPGICYRLYSQDEFESMNLNAAPEVLCKPISLAVLTLLELSVDPANFDWISPPASEAISNALRELKILGAVDERKKSTELGKLIAKCQQDPKTVKIIYSGCLKGLGEAACSVASLLSVSNIFFWNGNDATTKAESMQARKQSAMPEGDVVTIYRIFQNFQDTFNQRKENKSENSTDTVPTLAAKSAAEWFKVNYVNRKTLFMAFETKKELINQLKKTQIWSKFRHQNRQPTNLEIQQLMCTGYFIHCARLFHSRKANTTAEYFATESSVAGRLDRRSCFNLLDIEPPKWIVYDKIVRLPDTIFPVASVMDENWLKEENFDFYNLTMKKTETLPTEEIVQSISQVAFRMIVGRNFCNIDALEKELGCLLTGDAETGQMHLHCAQVNIDRVHRQITSKIENALTAIRKQVIEENYIGETRLIIGEGYEVHEILFENEFSTFYIKNIPKDFDKSDLEYILTINNVSLASLECTYHDKTYTAIAKFNTKKDAKSAFDNASKMNLTTTPCYGPTARSGIRHGLNCRLQLTWPTAKSKGIAKILFNTALDANNFLDNVRYIYPNVKVQVYGETKRRAEWRGRNGTEAPLTLLPYYQSGCRYRFDIDAINNSRKRNHFNYIVTLTGLKPTIDKFELMATLSNYDLKSVTVEYEDFAVPKSGNGLTPEEKLIKLEPLRRFMDVDTKTSDFFNHETGFAGICIFFNRNLIAKEAYDSAKAAYASLELRDLSYGPHRLNIDFTHVVSIRTELYKFLQSQIEALQKEARQKQIISNTTPIHDSRKTVVVKFHSSRLSLVEWIQEKLDELLHPTKFNCVDSDVLFQKTGCLELMKFSKKTYINWSDETHIIWVYGRAHEKEKTCKEIEDIAKHLRSLEVLDLEISLNKNVRINGKEVRNITNKCRDANLPFYHFYGNKLYLSGSQNAVDTVVQFLTQNKYSWECSKGNRFKYEETRECGLCFVPPDSTFIMLSVCGHLFCSTCIEPMLNMQPPPFPIKCPTCLENVALYDIRKFAPAKSLEKVLEMAVYSFQESHSNEIRKCPRPSCNQLLCYKQRSPGLNGGEFLFCTECITTYCICCSEKMGKPVKSHEEDSCDNIQNGVSNLVFKHVRLIQETILNLSCPRCNTAFYDFDGCAAVICHSCKAAFCGLCLADCGTDAHRHVISCIKNREQSFYVNQDALNAAHLDMRNEKLQAYLKQQSFTAKMQKLIIDKLRKDLIDLRMNVPIVTGDCEDETVEVSGEVMEHVHQIQGNILTLSCPACKAAFFDFDACACVNCYFCQKEFCGLCLDYYGTNTKTHVLTCTRSTKKGNIFFNSKELEQIHAVVRGDRVQSYFDNKINDSKTKEQVLSVIGRDLADAQIKMPDIINSQKANEQAQEQGRIQLGQQVWERLMQEEEQWQAQEQERMQVRQRAQEQERMQMRRQEQIQLLRAQEQERMQMRQRAEEQLQRAQEQDRMEMQQRVRMLRQRPKSDCCIL